MNGSQRVKRFGTVPAAVNDSAGGSRDQFNRSPLHWRLLAIINAYSIDAALVAVAWQALILRSRCGVDPTWSQHAAIFAATWLVYAADHALDAVGLPKHNDGSAPLRHRLYRDHSIGLFAVASAAIVVTAVGIAVQMSQSLELQCLIWLGLAMLYPILRASRWLNGSAMKAVVVAGIFAIGVHLLTGDRLGNDDWVYLPPTVGWAALAFYVNCRLVQRIDRPDSPKQNAILRRIAFDRTAIWIAIPTTAALLLVGVTRRFSFGIPIPVTLAAMAAIIASLGFAQWQRRLHPQPDSVGRASLAATYDLVLITSGGLGWLLC